jgi:hypothetical protein
MNIYSMPEKFGLTLVGGINFEHGYEYDIIAVWKDQCSRFLRGQSSGCSCSSPFDGRGMDDLEPTTPEEFQRYALGYAESKGSFWYAHDKDRWTMQITEMFERMVKP